MCSVLGLSYRKVMSLCKKNGCKVANIICNHKEDDLVKHNIFVCTGGTNNVVSLITAVEEIGGWNGTKPKAKKLKVSGAFHSVAMFPARAQLSIALNQMNITQTL